MLKWLVSLALALAAVMPAADVIILKSGGRLEGKVTENGDQIEIVLPYGSLTLPRDQVVKIVRSITSMEIYRQLKGVLGPNDIEGHYQLAQWCKENKLENHYYRELKNVLALDPDHEMARKELGYERHEGRWVTHDEAMAGRGYVKFREEWVSPQQRDTVLLEEMKKELEQEREKRELIEDRLRKLEQYAGLLEVELGKIQEEMKNLSEEVRRHRYVIIKRYYPVPPGFEKTE